MAGYFENYGAGEERRNRIILRSIVAALLLVVLTVAGYYFFRNRSENRKLQTFRSLLEQSKYEDAYVYWGCTPEKPCRYYSYEKFLRDWGPESGLDWNKLERVRKVTCTDGYGEGWKLGSGPDQTVHLWVVREDQALSFDPWPNWRQTWLAAMLNNCSGMTRGLSVQK